MSNRTSVVRVRRSAFAADVSCPRPLGRGFLLKAHALAFVQLVEAALHGAAVKEPLLSAVVANESEPSVANESLDRTGRHPSLLETRTCCPRTGISIFVPSEVFSFRVHLDGNQWLSRVRNTEKRYACVQTARRLVVVESQSPRFLPRRRHACDRSVGGGRGSLAPCARDARLITSRSELRSRSSSLTLFTC